MDRDAILLTPGPLTTTLRTKLAMLRDWGSWDTDFIAIPAELPRQQKAAEEAAKKRDAPPTTQAPAGPRVTGTFVCPVPGSSFSNSWGQPRSGGRGHRGVDMIAPTGTPSYAPVSGDVSFGTDSLGGRSWYLYGEEGNFYYGTHLSRFGPRDGQVSAGEHIGYVGMNSNASIPLHSSPWGTPAFSTSAAPPGPVAGAT